MPAYQVDWVQAQADYLTDNKLSYSDIAKKYGVSKTAVEKQARKTGWATVRQQLNEKSIEVIAGEIVDERAEANRKHTTIYRNMISLNAKYLAVANRNFDAYIDAHKDDTILDFRTNKQIMSPFNLQALMSSLKLAIEGERVTLNLPTAVTRNELTGKDGDPLFEETNIDELTKLIEHTAKAITEATNNKDKQQSPSSSKESSG